MTYYGVEHQIKKLNEEAYELEMAIYEYYRDICAEDHLIEEMADVWVMLSQFMLIFNLDEKKIEEEAKYKIARQLERIKKADLEKIGD